MIIGGQKRGFTPHLNYWGARAQAAHPRVYAYGSVNTT